MGSSSAVERLAVNQMAASSNLASSACTVIEGGALLGVLRGWKATSLIEILETPNSRATWNRAPMGLSSNGSGYLPVTQAIGVRFPVVPRGHGVGKYCILSGNCHRVEPNA